MGGGQRLQEAAYPGDKSSRRLFYLDLEAVECRSLFYSETETARGCAVYSGYIDVRVVADLLQEAFTMGREVILVFDWLQEAVYTGKRG